MKRGAFVTAALAAGLMPGLPVRAQDQPRPRIAVFGFDSAGLDPWWGVAGFDPGDAMSDILTDKLVNTNQYGVVDRDHIQQVLNEQNFSQTGAISPATEVKLGHLLGASYIMFGRIIQFDRTGSNGGSLGGITRGILGGVSVGSEKVTLHVSARIVDANSGLIVETLDETDSKSGTSFSLGGGSWGWNGAGAASYTSSDFTSSSVGKLITVVADALVHKMDPTKLVASAPTATLSAKVLDVDGSSVIINAGSNKHVSVGSYFTIFDVKLLKDPDTGKMLESHSIRGSLQITSVDAETATGQLLNGTAKIGQVVTSGQ